MQHHGQPLSESFGLLCWNVHKETLDQAFEPYLHHLLHICPSDLILLQETKTSLHNPLKLPGFSHTMAANIQTRRHLYGVLTAANASFESAENLLTQSREIHLTTYKSMLISSHKLADYTTLMLINIHAINFVPSQWFLKELHTLKVLLQKHSGAMIIAGDFNCWSQTRTTFLEQFCSELGLKKAALRNAHHIKQVFHRPLDHIFYRGLTLIKAKALDSGKLSDHNPLYARFSIYKTDCTAVAGRRDFAHSW